MLRQIEWWVQNGPIRKNGVLPVITLFFWEFCFSLRTSYKELIWCTNDPNAYIHTSCKRCSFIWRCFFPVSIFKNTYLKEHLGTAASVSLKFTLYQFFAANLVYSFNDLYWKIWILILSQISTLALAFLVPNLWQVLYKFYSTASMKHTKALEQALDSDENISEVNL